MLIVAAWQFAATTGAATRIALVRREPGRESDRIIDLATVALKARDDCGDCAAIDEPIELVGGPHPNQMLFIAGEGLWSFHPETREYKTLFAVNNPGLQQTFWADKLDDDEFMTDCGHGAAKFNLRTGQAELRHATSPVHDFSPRFPSTTRVKQTVAFTTRNGARTTNRTETMPSVPKASRWTDGSLNVGPPYVFVGDWVWTGRPFQRITRDGTKVEALPSLRPSLKRQGPATVLRLISAREILAGGQYGFWLLELPPAEASSPDPTK